MSAGVEQQRPSFKNRVRGLILTPPASSLLALTGGGLRTILMLHRFRDGARGRGMDVATLRQHLAWLRRERYQILSLADLVTELGGGRPRRGRGVVITIDDGYEEVAELAAPVLAEFDAPATTFVVSGFQDGHCWLWWDQVEYAVAHAPTRRLEVEVGGEHLRLAWDDGAGAIAAAARLSERLQWVPDRVRRETMALVARRCETEIPSGAPEGFRPMSWDTIRRCAATGMTFGPHTVTHPILAAVDRAEAEREVTESWRRLQQETSATVPVFCYPNGAAAAQSRWHAELLRRTGLVAAVTTVPGYAEWTRGRALTHAEAPYFISRFGWPETLPELAEYTSGIWRVRRLIRGAPPQPYRD